MKSAIFLGKGNVEVREIPEYVCGSNDVIVQNVFSSICGTDVAVYLSGPNTGHKIEIGKEFGHETVSRVIEVGDNVENFHVGQRVYPYPLYARGETSRAGTMGGFSERMLVPNAKLNRELYTVPAEISNRCACLIEPFTVGGHAAQQAHPAANETALIVGCGTIGIAAAITLSYLGLKRILICDLSKKRLEIARKLGFHTCSKDMIEVARGLFGTAASLTGDTANIDIFIDASGASFALDIFMEQGKIDSRFVAVAVGENTRKLNLLELTYGSKSIIGSGGYRPSDVQVAMNIMKSKRWDIESIITHEFKLKDIDQALLQAARPNEAFNVIIDMEA